MSRLTSKAQPHRPSMFDAPSMRPIPLSPPDTELEPGPSLPHEESHLSAEIQSFPTETAMPRARKASALAYTGGILMNRETKAQRQFRWLVTVVPPASLTVEPPSLGHTLSSAPAGRFSHGILMPLFPTLYGQLTAIAREYNMPSTVGLCLYLQLQDAGTSLLTPRISDESWQLLWGHFFNGEERAAPLPSHGLPISGRIEFDIDLRRAKWFNSWMGHLARESGEPEWPSAEPSMVPTHWRGESRTSSFHLEQAGEESSSPPESTGIATSSRAVPPRPQLRPLFLERRDTSTVKFASKLRSHIPSVSNKPPSPELLVQNTSDLSTIEPTTALPPVVQEPEGPLTAKKAELDSIVRQWRESSVIGAASTALAAAGQPSLDPVNMPPWADVELDLNDFTWSISSAGPPSEKSLSPTWSEPLPSVHLQDRLAGSVCLTPSVCTSFGPPEDDWLESPVSCVSRRPSPDLGLRMLEYTPLTPSTATSWGPDDLPSPRIGEDGYAYRAPSVDLGVRGMGSRLVTPSTATSWGPVDTPLFLPSSPFTVRTPDAGERGFLEARTLASPDRRAWTTQPWGHVWPYRAPSRRKSSQIAPSLPPFRSRNKTLLPEWPDFASLYPANTDIERAAANKSQPVQLPRPTGYPFFEIYPSIYPYNLDQIYPEMPLSPGPLSRLDHDRPTYVPGAQVAELLPEWPDFASLYPADPRVELAGANKTQPVGLRRREGYPSFSLYPSVYPYNLQEIYPYVQTIFYTQPLGLVTTNPHLDHVAAHSLPDRLGLARSQTTKLPEWPDFASLYPADPHVELAGANKSQPVSLRGGEGYPSFALYPSVYPYNLEEIYPSVRTTYAGELRQPITDPRSNRAAARSLPHHLGLARSQVTKLPEWPDFASLYPADPRVELAGANKSQPVNLRGGEDYPSFVLYPPVYPYNLQEIYPSVQATSYIQHFKRTITNTRSTIIVAGLYIDHLEFAGSHITKLLPEWPDFASLYPADPHVELAGANKTQHVNLRGYEGYPSFILYPSVYPYNMQEIYPSAQTISYASPLKPAITHTHSALGAEFPHFTSLYPADPRVDEPAGANKSQAVSLGGYGGYPSFVLYTAVYPHNLQEIYPPIQTVSCAQLSKSAIMETHSTPLAAHPLLEYPDFIGLYPANPLAERSGNNKSQPIGLPETRYPFFSIYSPVYPFNLDRIYGANDLVDAALECIESHEQLSVCLPVNSGYPAFNLYPVSNSYPTFEIYPPTVYNTPLLSSRLSINLGSYGYPYLEIYEPVYPNLVIYPQTQLATPVNDLTIGSVSTLKQVSTLESGRNRLRPSGSCHLVERELDTYDPSLLSMKATPVYTPSPSIPSPTITSSNGSPARKKARRTHLDLHLAVFGVDGDLGSITEAQPTYKPRRKPKRTHHDLHMLLFGDQGEDDPLSSDDVVHELPSRPPTQALPRQRKRSATVSDNALISSVRPVRESVGPKKPTSSRVANLASDHSITDNNRPTPTPNREIVSFVHGLPSSPTEPKTLSRGTPFTRTEVKRLSTRSRLSTQLTPVPNHGRSGSTSDMRSIGAHEQGTISGRTEPGYQTRVAHTDVPSPSKPSPNRAVSYCDPPSSPETQLLTPRKASSIYGLPSSPARPTYALNRVPSSSVTSPRKSNRTSLGK